MITLTQPIIPFNHQKGKETMKRNRKTILRISNSIISALLCLLGFNTACDIYGKYEYGSPNADFIIKGTIKSFETNQPIPQIKVKAGWDSVYSDASGKYEVVYNDFPESQDFLILFTDVDGVSNGAFHPLDTVVKFENPEFKDGNGHWYKGVTEKTVDIFLKP
jgi:putative lipoprotein (rSAM/lipoprotein system)